jgi:GntR family transcriptional regulator
MSGRIDTRPEHIKIAAKIREQIMAGTLEPGTQLPSTSQLVELHSAANATIQRATKDLKLEGFLSSHSGKGIYVRQHIPFAIDVAEQLPTSPEGYSYDLLEVSTVLPSVDIQSALEIDSLQKAVLRKRVLQYQGAPVEISYSYYPLDLADGTALTKKVKIRGGAPRVLADLGHVQDRFTDRISTRLPTTEELEILDIPDNVPVIRQFRVIYSEKNRPLEVSVLVKSGHLYELRYQQKIGR